MRTILTSSKHPHPSISEIETIFLQIVVVILFQKRMTVDYNEIF